MSDIVDELRDYIPGMPVGWLLDEAKDEIEALRAEVETWKESHAAACDLAERHMNEKHALRATNERLRAALDTVRASGLLIGSTTLHDRVRSAVYNAIDANPAAMKETP